VVATREIGMGEVLLGRERPFAAVLSEDEGAYKVQVVTVTMKVIE
jgi:hypothetical protein